MSFFVYRICIDLTHWSDYFHIIASVLGDSGWINSVAGLLAEIYYPTNNNNYDYQIPAQLRFVALTETNLPPANEFGK